jgi:ABC-type branched-subunit amino acid transport system substrate-binding protein
MVAGDFTSSGLAYTTPEVVPAVKGALRDDPQITVITCDTKSDSAAADQCEEEAVQDKVAAVVLGFSDIGQDQSILTAAGIPVIGDAESDSKATTAFSLANGNAEYYGIGIGLAEAGCTSYGALYLDGTDALTNAIKSGAATKGLKEAARAAIADNAPDLAPAIAKLTSANVDCIALSVVPTQVVQAVTAIDQTGKKIRVGAVSAIFLSQVISALGSSLNGAISINQVRDVPDSAAPGSAMIQADMAAEDPKAPITQLAVIAWVSAKLILDALPSIHGAVTASSMLTALNGLRNANTYGMTEPFSAVPLTNPLFTRMFNPYAINYVIQNGQSASSGGFYNLTAALDG